jgi:DNA-binding PadR family transcriptional regulator
MLDLALLGLLEDGELHGYELRRRLRTQFGFLTNVSFGSIYPALGKLEAAGAVETVEAATSGPPAPPSGSLSGEWAALRARRRASARGRRSKKVYRITAVGRAHFLDLLSDPTADDPRSFALRLAFARHLPPDARLALLERRRAQLVQRLTETPPDGGRLDAYARSVIEHTTEGVEQDIDWLDRLIEAERATVGLSAAPVQRA